MVTDFRGTEFRTCVDFHVHGFRCTEFIVVRIFTGTGFRGTEFRCRWIFMDMDLLGMEFHSCADFMGTVRGTEFRICTDLHVREFSWHGIPLLCVCG